MWSLPTINSNYDRSRKDTKVTEISQSKGWSISVDDKINQIFSSTSNAIPTMGRILISVPKWNVRTLIPSLLTWNNISRVLTRITKPIYGLEMMGTVKWRTLPHQGHCIGYGGSGKTNTRLVGSTWDRIYLMRMMMIYKTNSKMSLFCCYTTNTKCSIY